MPILASRADDAPPRLASDRIERLRTLGCYLIAAALLAWPILRVANPMLADYPNHLARRFIVDALPGNAALARFYLARNDFYPYLPMDLIVGVLHPLLGLEWAAKVFVVVAMLMPLAGTAALARVLHGRVGLWPLAAALFAYNFLLGWGFTTYLFAAGLALCAFAGWIATERWRWWPRLALFAGVSAVLFCSHPFAFAAYGLLFSAWEIGRTGAWTWPALRTTAFRVALAGIQALPPLVIALSLPRAEFGNDATVYGNPISRLLALLSPFFFAVDLGEVVCFVLLLAAFATALRIGATTFDRRLAWPLAFLGIATLAMPQTLSGIYLVHMRLPLLFVLLLIVACRPRPQTPRIAALSVAAIMAMLALRTSTAAERLAEADRNVAELRAAGAAIEPGARVLPTISSERIGGLPIYHYWHATAYLTIDRSAFNPLIFSFFSIEVVPALKASSAPATSPAKFEALLTRDGEPERVAPLPGQIRYWKDWRRVFDYVVDFDDGVDAIEVPPELSIVRRGSVFTLYKIER